MYPTLQHRRFDLVTRAAIIAALIAAPSLSRCDEQASRVKIRTKTGEGAMLIEATQLEQKLADSRLRVLDTRSQEEYERGHIPGALWVDVSAWQDLAKRQDGFRDAQAWGAIVSSLGIDHGSHAVVYGSRLSDTARVWWTLKYLGLADVTILNGGWDVWIKGNHPPSVELPKVTATRFEPRFQEDRLEEIDHLKQAIQAGKTQVIDARSADEYSGKEVRGKRAGHIAGATHLEWKELLASDGRFKSRAELQELFRKRGVLPEDTAVCY